MQFEDQDEGRRRARLTGTLFSKRGNPRLSSLSSILDALGVEVRFAPKTKAAEMLCESPPPAARGMAFPASGVDSEGPVRTDAGSGDPQVRRSSPKPLHRDGPDFPA